MIRIIGHMDNRKVYVDLKTKGAKYKQTIRAALHEIGQDHVKEIQDLMIAPKTGLPYFVNNRWMISSAPGEAPAIRTGLLFRSVFYEVPSWNYLQYGNDIKNGNKKDYPGYLEDGTKFMDPRPSVKTATDNLSQQTRMTFERHLAKL